jgi:hypothetical protein
MDYQTDHVLGEIEQEIQAEVEDATKSTIRRLVGDAYDLGLTVGEGENDHQKLDDITNQIMAVMEGE